VDNLLLLLCSSDSHCSELQDSNMYDTMMSQFICSGHPCALWHHSITCTTAPQAIPVPYDNVES